MRIATLSITDLKTLSLAVGLAGLPATALAQYSQPYGGQTQPYSGQVQPYNSQDPNNYGYPASQSYGAPGRGYDRDEYDASEDQPYAGQEQVYVAPPVIPDYAQPEAPGDGYIWTPGYWAWGRGGYYWVPGQWVLPPYQDALWTPGYWGYGYGGGYAWNPGYWGLTVGYYGGINYGFGYFGTGFYGGYWRNHNYFYNREYAHLGFRTRNFYSERVGWGNGGHPGGQSFTDRVVVNNSYRGGSYNRTGEQFRRGPGDQNGAGEARGQNGQQHVFFNADGRAGGSYGNWQQRGGTQAVAPQSGVRQAPVQQRMQQGDGGSRSQQPTQMPQQQTLSGRQAYTGGAQGAGGFGNDGYRNQPQQQTQQYRMPQQMQQGGGNYSRPYSQPQGQQAPQSFHQSPPVQQRSAPSGGGGFGGGGSRGGGGGFAGGGARGGSGHR